MARPFSVAPARATDPLIAMTHRLRQLHHGFLTALLALPWLWPFAPGPSPNFWPWAIAWGCALLAAVMAPARLDLPAGIRVACRALIAAAFVNVLLGLLQYFKMEGPLEPWVVTGTIDRISHGNVRQPNQFATLMALAWFALAHLSVGKGGSRTPRRQVVDVGLAFVFGQGIMLAASRTGVLELIAMGVATLLWGWRSGAFKALLGLWFAMLCGYAVSKVGLPLLADPFAVVIDPACVSRLVIWPNMWQLVMERPWLGWGWDGVPHAMYVTTFSNRFCETLDHAHNLPLQAAVTMGLPIAAVLTVATAWFVWKTWPPGRHHGFGATHAACGMLGMVLLHSMLEHPLWYGTFQVVTLACVVVLWRMRATAAGSGSWAVGVHASVAALWGHRRVLACAGLLTLAAAGWDHWRVGQLFERPEDRHPAFQVDALQKVGGSVFFGDLFDVATLSAMPDTPATAPERLRLAELALRHFPAPMLIQYTIAAAHLAKREDRVRFHRERYALAFPRMYALWVKGHGAKLGAPTAPVSALPASSSASSP